MKYLDTQGHTPHEHHSSTRKLKLSWTTKVGVDITSLAALPFIPQVTYEQFGEKLTHDLVPGGGEIPVTQHNRAEYVRCSLIYLFIYVFIYLCVFIFI